MNASLFFRFCFATGLECKQVNRILQKIVIKFFVFQQQTMQMPHFIVESVLNYEFALLFQRVSFSAEKQ